MGSEFRQRHHSNREEHKARPGCDLTAEEIDDNDRDTNASCQLVKTVGGGEGGASEKCSLHQLRTQEVNRQIKALHLHTHTHASTHPAAVGLLP